jgi:hypothetical protein
MGNRIATIDQSEKKSNIDVSKIHVGNPSEYVSYVHKNNHNKNISLKHASEHLAEDVLFNELETNITGKSLKEAENMYPMYHFRVIKIDSEWISVHQNLSQKRINIILKNDKIDSIHSLD